MKLFASIMILAATTAAISASGQKIKWENGEGLAFLKGQDVLNVAYDYSSITVKGQPEADYVTQQKEDLNKEKAGDGDEFEHEWTEAREAKYQVHFEREFNKTLKGKSDSVTIHTGDDAKYTVIIKANDMELGKGKTFVSKPAKMTFTITIVETANQDNILAKGVLEKVEGEVKAPKGSGFIPGAGGAMALTANVQNRSYSNRLAECYEKAGGALAKYIKKNVL